VNVIEIIFFIVDVIDNLYNILFSCDPNYFFHIHIP